MATKSPFFSIVMPTRNRADLLRYALQSALEQTFTDYEIVVSDNQSPDHTAEVVKEVGGDRVRYVRTGSGLPMHDSWEFALTQAQGQWVLFLCDDDALYPEALQIIHAAIEAEKTELVCWAGGSYVIPSEYSPVARRGQVVAFNGTGQRIVKDSSKELETLFQLGSSLHLPKMLNSCCHQDLIARVKQRVGRMFLPPAPDFSCCAAMLALTPKFVVIDGALYLGGAGSHVPGMSEGKPTSHVQFANDFKGKMFRYMPLSHATGMNSAAESLIEVQKLLEPEMSHLKLDMAAYFIGAHGDLVNLESDGLNIGELRQEFNDALKREPMEVQNRVHAAMRAIWLRSLVQKPIVRKVASTFGVQRLLDATIRRRKRKVVGWGGGFPTILEAVRHAHEYDDAYRKANEYKFERTIPRSQPLQAARTAE